MQAWQLTVSASRSLCRVLKVLNPIWAWNIIRYPFQKRYRPKAAEPCTDPGQRVAFGVDWAAHSHSIVVIALSPEGTEPDIDISRRFLLVQVATPGTDTGQQVASHAGLTAHRVFIAVMALSPEGTEPDTDVLWNPLSVPSSRAMHSHRSAGSICVWAW